MKRASTISDILFVHHLLFYMVGGGGGDIIHSLGLVALAGYFERCLLDDYCFVWN